MQSERIAPRYNTTENRRCSEFVYNLSVSLVFFLSVYLVRSHGVPKKQLSDCEATSIVREVSSSFFFLFLIILFFSRSRRDGFVNNSEDIVGVLFDLYGELRRRMVYSIRFLRCFSTRRTVGHDKCVDFVDYEEEHPSRKCDRSVPGEEEDA